MATKATRSVGATREEVVEAAFLAARKAGDQGERRRAGGCEQVDSVVFDNPPDPLGTSASRVTVILFPVRFSGRFGFVARRTLLL